MRESDQALRPDAPGSIRVLLFHLPPSGRDAFPISLGYIAVSLRAYGVSVRIVDLTTGGPYSPQWIEDLLAWESPELLGFSGYQVNMDAILGLAGLAKAINPRIVTVLGGPQATFMPRDALSQITSIDILCRGEGETITPKIVQALDNDFPLSSVAGIVFRDGDEIVETPPAPLTVHLDRFPSPYRNQVFDFSEHAVASLLTSRGCPYSCRFCYTPKFYGKKVHYHSPGRVIEDLGLCVDNGIHEVVFYDPSFTVDAPRVRAIMQGILDHGWNLSIWCETRTDLVDRQLLSLMARAGVKRIAYGLESIQPHTLEMVNKRLDLRQFAHKIRETQEAGIEVEIYTLFGLPGQTSDGAMKTSEYVKSLGVRLIGNSSGQQLSLFFGTDITARPEDFGIRVHERVRPLYVSPGNEFETDHMTGEEISKLGEVLKEENLLAHVTMQALGITGPSLGGGGPPLGKRPARMAANDAAFGDQPRPAAKAGGRTTSSCRSPIATIQI